MSNSTNISLTSNIIGILFITSGIFYVILNFMDSVGILLTAYILDLTAVGLIALLVHMIVKMKKYSKLFKDVERQLIMYVVVDVIAFFIGFFGLLNINIFIYLAALFLPPLFRAYGLYNFQRSFSNIDKTTFTIVIPIYGVIPLVNTGLSIAYTSTGNENFLTIISIISIVANALQFATGICFLVNGYKLKELVPQPKPKTKKYVARVQPEIMHSTVPQQDSYKVLPTYGRDIYSGTQEAPSSTIQPLAHKEGNDGEKNFCEYCGIQLSEKSNFCPNCGQKL